MKRLKALKKIRILHFQEYQQNMIDQKILISPYVKSQFQFFY